jgi:hypothetical protein
VGILTGEANGPGPGALCFRVLLLCTTGGSGEGKVEGDSESRQMLEHATEAGRGGVYLRLTPDQYRRLRGS